MSHNPAFTLLQEKHIPSLNIDIQEFQHIETKAQHIHIKADNNENVFMVAQRTVPMDSTGVAHILEHTALCGSKKYPVRDPFFMMIRRSLNTFMNAMTSSDWTAYPFASQNKKDFRNLLDVYLDAVFFSRLDPLDFAQEGHRLEFETRDDSSTPLVYKGVVYNEMKGAMSSITSQLWQQLSKHLYPTTTYHYNSGGEPDDIPNLTYNELKDFYQKHYHPSNSTFMTFGDIPVIEHQDYFQDAVLQHFSYSDNTISVEKEQRYSKPIAVEELYPIPANDALEAKTHHVIGWLLGESTSLTELLKAHLLSTLLFDNSASPLMNALETTDLGSAPSPLCGMDDSHLEMVFVCGIEGSDPEHSDAFEALVLNTLSTVAEHGIPQEQLDAALHQLELQQREIGGDSYPYGLQIMMSALSSTTHRGNPIELIDLAPALEQLQNQAKEKDFVQNLVKELLLNNTHRVRLTLKPDNTLNEAIAQQTQEKLNTIKAALNEEEKQNIIDTAQALAQRQNEQDDNSILPKVGLDDIAQSISSAESTHHSNDITHYSQGTNGLTYQQILLNLPELSDEEVKLLPIYCNVITELGLGENSYLESQMRQSAVTGGISASLHQHTHIDNEQKSQHQIVFSGKALNSHSNELHQLLFDTLQSVRFDESQRLEELFAQMVARRERSITNNGHVLAMQTAISGMSPSANLTQQLSGLMGIQSLKSLQKNITMADLGLALSTIHQKVIKQKAQYLLVSEEEHKSQALDGINKAPLSCQSSAGFSLAQPLRENRWEYWETNSQISFCALAFKTVPYNHPDNAPLMVLGAFLRNGFLHRAIREQGGAYGAGASQDNQNAAFRFFSYRDPRIDGTIDDFKASIEWLLKTEHQAEPLEEAILGIIASMDKPSSPAGQAKNDFYFRLSGKSMKVRMALRQRLLSVTLDDLQRVATEYLHDKAHSVAIVSNKESIEKSQLSKQYSFTHKKIQ